MTVANLHHKNIVTVHEFGEENGVPYLVMEYLEGTNLHDLIRQRSPLSLQEKLSIMSEVAEGLRCAHDRGVIHRDVKPANIMRLTDGSVKIMDFGIARLARVNATRLTHTGLVIGTLMYMAPEQFSGTADALTDIFAYGVTFYELLTGRHPFQFSQDPAVMMNRIMNVEPEPLRSLVPECPEPVERIVNRTLAKNREARYSSLADVVADTRPILQDLSRQQAGQLFARADELLRDDQLDAAQSAIRKALELDPWHSEARVLRSRVEEALHQRDLLSRAGQGQLEPDNSRPYVAAASIEGLLVNQHLGEAARFVVFQEDSATDSGFRFVEIRKAPIPGSGGERWKMLGETLSDCRAILVNAAGPSPTLVLKQAGIRVVEMEGMIEDGLRYIFKKEALPAAARRKFSGCSSGSSCRGTGTGCG